MFEMIFLTILLFMILALYMGYPFIQHFRSYRQ